MLLRGNDSIGEISCDSDKTPTSIDDSTVLASSFIDVARGDLVGSLNSSGQILDPEEDIVFWSNFDNTIDSALPHQFKIRASEVRGILESNPRLRYGYSKMLRPQLVEVQDGLLVFAESGPLTSDRFNVTYPQAEEVAQKMGLEIIDEKAGKKIYPTGTHLDKGKKIFVKTSPEIQREGQVLVAIPSLSFMVSSLNITTKLASIGWRGMLNLPRA